MSLLDSYLLAVKHYLPPTADDDIIDELRDELSSQAEALEQQRGEPLSEKDWHQLLLQAGHPANTAARYSGAQPLLGTEATGLFWLALKPLAYLLVAIYGALAVYRVFIGQNLIQAAIQNAHSAAFAFVLGVGALLLTLMILERQNVSLTLFKRWHPAQLPSLASKAVIPRSESVFEIIFGVVFIVWWLGQLDFASHFPREGHIFEVALSGAWQPYFYPILMLSLIELALAIINVAQPVRTAAKACVRMMVALASLFIASQLLQADALLTITGQVEQVDNFARVKRWLEWSVDSILVVIVVVYVFEVVSDWRLLWRSWRAETPAENGSQQKG